MLSTDILCVEGQKVIIFLSTIHADTSSLSVSRIARDESRLLVNCPPCLPDYQEFMGGVDLSDPRMSYYYVGRRSKKWWKRFFPVFLKLVVRTHMF